MTSATTKRLRLCFPSHDVLHAALGDIYDEWEPSWEVVPGNRDGMRTRTPGGELVSWYKPRGKTEVQGCGDIIGLSDTLRTYVAEGLDASFAPPGAITTNFRPRLVANTVLILYRDLSDEADELATYLRTLGLCPEMFPIGEKQDVYTASCELDRVREQAQFAFLLSKPKEWKKGKMAEYASVTIGLLGVQQNVLLTRSRKGKSIDTETYQLLQFPFSELDEVLQDCIDYVYSRLDRNLQRQVKSVASNANRLRFRTIDEEVPPEEMRVVSSPCADM